MSNTLPHVSKEQAIALKELGFDWPTRECMFIGDGSILASSIDMYNSASIISVPLMASCIMWFRVKKGLYGHLDFLDLQKIYINDSGYLVTCRLDADMSNLKTYEEAESALLDHLIEHLKEKRK
jgi:hypothetical protein